MRKAIRRILGSLGSWDCKDSSPVSYILLSHGPKVSNPYCEDLGETLCPPDRAGMVDVTQGVAAESSFALAKGNVKGTVFSGPR